METSIQTVRQPEGSKQELRELLVLAESLQEKCEVASDRLVRLRLVAITFVVVFVAVGIVGISTTALQVGTFDTGLFLVILGGGCLAVLFYSSVLVKRVKLRLKRDRRALEDIIEMVRETEGVIAQAEDWSRLERAEFRIRLSRFDIS